MARMFNTITVINEVGAGIKATGMCLDEIIKLLKEKKLDSNKIERLLKINMFLLSKVILKGLIFKYDETNAEKIKKKRIYRSNE